MLTAPLSSFIAHARGKGMDHQTIRMILLSAGWKEKDVSQALASESLDVAVPLPADTGGARDAFFHLLSFTSLISTVISSIFLFFNFLERLLPDAAFPVYYDNVSSVRWELAVLIVSYPLYLWMSRLLLKEFSVHEEKLASGIRRWLTYLILFATACTLVGDLISLIFFLLQGEVTLRFLLKVGVVLVLAGLPFRYYLYSLRIAPDHFSKHKIHMRYFYCSVAIVLAAVIGAFLVTGSPLRGRAERFDEQRVNDLRAINSEIMNITGVNKQPLPPTTLPEPLPQTLEAVSAQAVYQQVNITDPDTGAPYTYRITSDHEYDLCATFDLVRDQQYDIFWNHPAGEHCYKIDVLDTQVR